MRFVQICIFLLLSTTVEGGAVSLIDSGNVATAFQLGTDVMVGKEFTGAGNLEVTLKTENNITLDVTPVNGANADADLLTPALLEAGDHVRIKFNAHFFDVVKPNSGSSEAATLESDNGTAGFVTGTRSLYGAYLSNDGTDLEVAYYCKNTSIFDDGSAAAIATITIDIKSMLVLKACPLTTNHGGKLVNSIKFLVGTGTDFDADTYTKTFANSTNNPCAGTLIDDVPLTPHLRMYGSVPSFAATGTTTSTYFHVIFQNKKAITVPHAITDTSADTHRILANSFTLTLSGVNTCPDSTKITKNAERSVLEASSSLTADDVGGGAFDVGYKVLFNLDDVSRTCNMIMFPLHTLFTIAADEYVRVLFVNTQIVNCVDVSASIAFGNQRVAAVTRDTKDVQSCSSITPGYGSVNVHCGTQTCNPAPA